MTIEQRIYAGDRAREVLENEVFQQVFKDLHTEITEQWKKSPARDEEGKEKLWLMQSLLTKLESLIQTSLETGKLARLELEHQRSVADRLKDLVR